MKHFRGFLGALATTSLILGCAHSSALPQVDNSFKYLPTDAEKRARIPSCKASVPLTREEAIQVAKLVDGAEHLDQRQDCLELMAKVKNGDQIRYVWCIPQGRGGVAFFALYRDSALIYTMQTVMLD